MQNSSRQSRTDHSHYIADINDIAAASNHLAIYVHWPFCLSKCPYCDFNSHVRDHIDETLWRDAYRDELSYYAQLMPDRVVSSIYFGGGTPSLMSAQTVQSVIDNVRAFWPMVNDVDITLEANPTSVEREKFHDFYQAGIRRVSIGVQALDQASLSFLGRGHNVDEALKAIEVAQDQFDAYSFDLIYARPEQTLSDWEAELTHALRHVGSHMSLYQLTIEPGTAFHTQYQRGDFAIPPDDMAAQFYELTQDIMSDAGLPAYEISNHARIGAESRHNLSYWRYGSYIGIGPGAHGRYLKNLPADSQIDFKSNETVGDSPEAQDVFDYQKIATRTHLAPEKWIEYVTDKGHGQKHFEVLSKRQQAEEWLMMGLRLNTGVRLSDCAVMTGYDIDHLIDVDAMEMLMAEGFLTSDGGVLSATLNGRLCLNLVLGKIINDHD